jgi:hypothetical protein
MKRLAMMLVAACALTFALVAISPDQASAGWRRGWGWGYGPGVGVYVGPGYGYYGGYRPYPYYAHWRWLLSLRLLSLLARTLAPRLGLLGKSAVI